MRILCSCADVLASAPPPVVYRIAALDPCGKRLVYCSWVARAAHASSRGSARHSPMAVSGNTSRAVVFLCTRSLALPRGWNESLHGALDLNAADYPARRPHSCGYGALSTLQP